MSDQVPVTVNPYATGFDVSHHDMSELFPQVDPQFRPYGSRVLVQLRRVVEMSRGGIILSTEATEGEAWNMQVGKLISMGPLAFKDRRTAAAWPEGTWASLGEYVRVPRWGGDRLTVPMPSGKPVTVLIMNDTDLLGAYSGDPRDVRTYIE